MGTAVNSIIFRCEDCGRCWMRHGIDLAITVDECPDCGGVGRVYKAESVADAKSASFTKATPRVKRFGRKA